MEERFALWMNKQLKKMADMDFHLKLSDVPQENIKGFRLEILNTLETRPTSKICADC